MNYQVDVFYKTEGQCENILKALFPIDVTNDGNDISARDEQPSNELFSIDITDGGIIIFVRDLHPLNALFPIEVTDDGIVI